MTNIVVSKTVNEFTVTPQPQAVSIDVEEQNININTANYAVSVAATPVTIMVDSGIGTLNTTDDLPQGTTNLYYSNSLVNDWLQGNNSASISDLTVTSSLTTTTTCASVVFNNDNIMVGNSNIGGRQGFTIRSSNEAGYIAYNSATNKVEFSEDGTNWYIIPRTTSDLPEGNSHYFTDQRFDTRFQFKSTDDLAEGQTNLYHTNARARNALVAGTGVTYDNTTGTISIGQSVATSASPTFASINISNNNTQTIKGVQGTMAGDDYWFIGGYDISAGGSNMGAMVIATGNNGDIMGAAEPIYVRQYGGGDNTQPFPGSNTTARTLTLLDNWGNTRLPGKLRIDGNELYDSSDTRMMKLYTDNNGTKFISFGPDSLNSFPNNPGPGSVTLYCSGVNYRGIVSQTSRRGTLTTAGVAQIMDGYSAAGQRAAKYVIQFSVAGRYQIWEGLVIHDDDVAFVNAYGDLRTQDNLAVVSTEWNNDKSILRLMATPTYANTQFTLVNIIFAE